LEVYMNTARMNITIPGDVGDILAEVKNKSAYIAEAVREKKQVEEKKRLRQELSAAYKQAAKEEYETHKEWEDTMMDGLDE
jgi:hypothetical protein